jgi:hypothetical protein
MDGYHMVAKTSCKHVIADQGMSLHELLSRACSKPIERRYGGTV